MKRTAGRIALWLTAVGMSLILAGCAARRNVVEILQLPRHATVHTAYNLRYADPMEIPQNNYLSGQVLPFGTPVGEIVAEGRDIYFTTLEDGTRHRLRFDPHWAMVTIEEFLRGLFTTEDPRLIKEQVTPALYQRMLTGKVSKNMTREQVILTYGPPPIARTPFQSSDTWTYWVDPQTTIRVVFNKDAVSSIIQ